ncbi:MAG: limonene-1,2-epoxide hydrolase family protein [Pseudomonadota bacterium]
MSNIERARSFIEAWENRDVDAIVEAAANDIVYHNIPMEPVIGKDALRAAAAPFLQMSERVVWETPHIAETADGAVLTERLDHFHLAGGKTISVRVMGVFEFDGDGKVSKWRDYFDLAEFQSQMPG